jgi:glucose/arabinose dehydrogenase
MRIRLALGAIAAVLLLPSPALAAPSLEPVGDFSAPVHVTAPPDDPRVFVVERAGRIRIAGRAAPFLDVAREVSTAGERGMLSVAFAPDYAASGLLYAFMTPPDGSLQVREFRRSAADPDRAEAGPGGS